MQVLDGGDVVVGQVQRSEGRQVQGGVHPLKGVASTVQAGQVGPGGWYPPTYNVICSLRNGETLKRDGGAFCMDTAI